MSLTLFDKTRAPAPTHASARDLRLDSPVRKHPDLALAAPFVCAWQTIDLLSGEFASAVSSSGEAEDVRACARASPDKARETLILPLAGPLATPLSPLNRGKTDDNLDALLLPVPGQRGMKLARRSLLNFGQARFLSSE